MSGFWWLNMGKSQKPLTILCHPDIAAWEEVQKLAEQGHRVLATTSWFENGIDDEGPDLILHPLAWRMDTQHRKYLPLAIAAGRAKRYPKEK